MRHNRLRAMEREIQVVRLVTDVIGVAGDVDPVNVFLFQVGKDRILREQVRDLLTVVDDYEVPSPLHRIIRDFLQTNGASFLIEIDDALKQTNEPHTAKERDAALRDLVWAGQITKLTALY